MSIGKKHIEWAQCACGCGKSFPKFDKWGRSRKFISGHNSLGNKHRTGTRQPDAFKIKMAQRMIGEKNPSWNGGRTFTEEGYVLILCPEHPHKKSGNYVYEHRLVMEQYLGRFLKPEEVVNHINGNKADNRLENLQLFSEDSEHAKFEGRGKRENILRAVRISSDIRRRPRILIFCSCGCGSLIENLDKKGRSRQFIHGHNMRGKPRPDMIGDKNPRRN